MALYSVPIFRNGNGNKDYRSKAGGSTSRGRFQMPRLSNWCSIPRRPCRKFPIFMSCCGNHMGRTSYAHVTVPSCCELYCAVCLFSIFAVQINILRIPLNASLRNCMPCIEHDGVEGNWNFIVPCRVHICVSTSCCSHSNHWYIIYMYNATHETVCHVSYVCFHSLCKPK